MSERAIGIVGCGKIARDQHLPTIAASPDFRAVAGADPHAACPGLPGYPDLAAMLAAHPEIEAVAMCQPPAFRHAAAREALLAGKHVLLEKPPGTTVAAVEELCRLADERRLTLFAAWHSQQAAAVAPARDWLATANIEAITVTWKEDVRHWHPGQAWIWERDGFGVFDPGINALSILSALLDGPIALHHARLEQPRNRRAPIAARLDMATASGAPILAEFDWRQTGQQTWDIRIETGSGVLLLSEGGNRLTIDGAPHHLGEDREYPGLYRQFATLIGEGRSDVDLTPLRLVSEAIDGGETIETEDFLD